MIIEIHLPDETPDALKQKIAAFAKEQSADPALIEDFDETDIAALYTPERMAKIEAARQEAERGELHSDEEVDAILGSLRRSRKAAKSA